VTLRQLRGLLAVAEAGTISAAARQLNLSPPAVSLQLRELEKAAGVALLERRAQRLQPTEAGREVLRTAARVERALLECNEVLDALGGGDSGRVAVGVLSTARYFAPQVLAAFTRRHPGVKLQLAVGNRETTLAALEGLELDLAITGRLPEQLDVRAQCIGEHPQIVIAAADHPLAPRRKIPLAALRGETFLLREAGSGTRSVADGVIAEAGIDAAAGIEFGSNETIKQAVMAGMGIAVISGHTVAAEIADGRLCALDVQGLPIIRQWFVVKHARKQLPPSAQALWQFIVGHCGDYLPRL